MLKGHRKTLLLLSLLGCASLTLPTYAEEETPPPSYPEADIHCDDSDDYTGQIITNNSSEPEIPLCVRVDVEEILEFTYAGPAIFTVEPGTSAISEPLETKISTNSTKGYSLYVKTFNGEFDDFTYTTGPSLQSTMNGTLYTIPALGDPDGPNLADGSDLPVGVSAWGIGCVASDTSVCEYPDGFISPTTEDKLVLKRNTYVFEDNAGITAGVTVGMPQPAGTYRGAVVLTAIMNTD